VARKVAVRILPAERENSTSATLLPTSRVVSTREDFFTKRERRLAKKSPCALLSSILSLLAPTNAISMPENKADKTIVTITMIISAGLIAIFCFLFEFVEIFGFLSLKNLPLTAPEREHECRNACAQAAHHNIGHGHVFVIHHNEHRDAHGDEEIDVFKISHHIPSSWLIFWIPPYVD
jgi:hypothetical protein